jgi:hypothetical protein
LVIGTILIALGLWGISAWWDAFAFAMRALVPFAALTVGVLAVLSSYSRMGGAIDGGEAESDERAGE